MFSMLLIFLTFVQKKNKTSNILQKTLYWLPVKDILSDTFHRDRQVMNI